MILQSQLSPQVLRVIGVALGAAAALAGAGWFALVQALDVAGAVLAALI